MIDCYVSDADAAADFGAIALGRPGYDPRCRANYRMLETPRDEQNVELQRAGHERRVHIDIETDDIAAGVARLEKLGAKAADRPARWVMQAPAGQRFCVVHVQRPEFPKNANRWG